MLSSLKLYINNNNNVVNINSYATNWDINLIHPNIAYLLSPV
jgi:hypothetical protein